MEPFVKISDVSEALGVPTSTLRFWDKEGLIRFERNDDNNYRNFSYQTMLDICDIIFFRSLELPLSTIKIINTKSADDLNLLLKETKTELEQKIAYLQQVTERIEAREKKLEKYQHMQAQPLRVIKAKLSPVRSFNFQDKEMVQLYLDDPGLSADILAGPLNDSMVCGMFVDSEVKNIIREGDDEERNYLYGLLWMNRDKQMNAEQFWSTSQRLGYKPGHIICKYLVSTKEEGQELRNFFEAWLEID